VVLGRRLGPYQGRIDADLVRRFAEVTGDPHPGSIAGRAVPPMAVVTQIWDAQVAAYDELVPDHVKGSMAGGVHGAHDVVLHRPLVPGDQLRTWVEAVGSRRGGHHLVTTIRYATHDRRGALVAEQWWTTVFLAAAGDPVGEPAPDHAFPEAARERRVGQHRIGTDAELPRRYAAVSGDWSDHHFDVEAARRSGAERPFLHGLCTMALCAQSLVALVAGGDPERLRRVAVRFRAPVLVGDDVEIEVYEAGERTYAFEAASAGVTVITDGRAELR
jgi:acyl dehydratase